MTETENIEIRKDGNLTNIIIKNAALNEEDEQILKDEIKSIVERLLFHRDLRARWQNILKEGGHL